jgi:hypothetical protein
MRGRIMEELPITDIALTGFRVVREHPRALIAWSLYALATSSLFGFIIVVMMGADFTRVLGSGSQPPADPAVLTALIGRLAPGYLVLILAGIVANSVVSGAMLRAVLRPNDDRFGFLRLGADELRQLGLGLITALLLFGVYVGLVIAVLTLATVMSQLAAAAGALLMFVGVLAAAVALLVISVRLSLAPALTFDTGRIVLWRSWSLTRGRFWGVFGAYLIAVILVAVVYLVSALFIFAVVSALAGGNPMSAIFQPDTSSLAAYFSPPRLAQLVLSAGVTALIWPVLYTPPAAIYLSLSPSGTRAAAAFS